MPAPPKQQLAFAGPAVKDAEGQHCVNLAGTADRRPVADAPPIVHPRDARARSFHEHGSETVGAPSASASMKSKSVAQPVLLIRSEEVDAAERRGHGYVPQTR